MLKIQVKSEIMLFDMVNLVAMHTLKNLVAHVYELLRFVQRNIYISLKYFRASELLRRIPDDSVDLV